MKKVLVLIPAYNEAESIEKVVDDLRENHPYYDYLIVNDGSKDNTLAVCKKRGYHVMTFPVNLGLECGFIAGMKYAYRKGYDYIVQFDADGQHISDYISDIYEEIEMGYDIVIGSRFATEKKPASLRMLGSSMISLAIKITTGKTIKDPTSGMRMYNRKCMEIFSKDINYGPEPDTISYLIRNDFKVSEVQVEMKEREAGKSYLTISKSISYMFKMMTSILLVQAFRKKVG